MNPFLYAQTAIPEESKFNTSRRLLRATHKSPRVGLEAHIQSIAIAFA